MILLSFRRWSSANVMFVWERIYWRGKWTPFCRVSIRAGWKWTLKQLLPLKYESNFIELFDDGTYAVTHEEWRMWFGRSFWIEKEIGAMGQYDLDEEE